MEFSAQILQIFYAVILVVFYYLKQIKLINLYSIVLDH